MKVFWARFASVARWSLLLAVILISFRIYLDDAPFAHIMEVYRVALRVVLRWEDSGTKPNPPPRKPGRRTNAASSADDSFAHAIVAAPAGRGDSAKRCPFGAPRLDGVLDRGPTERAQNLAFISEYSSTALATLWLCETISREQWDGNGATQCEPLDESGLSPRATPREYTSRPNEPCDVQSGTLPGATHSTSTQRFERYVSYITNVVPMAASVKMESWLPINDVVRALALEHGAVQIVSGSIPDSRTPWVARSREGEAPRLETPRWFYKIVVASDAESKSITVAPFLVENVPNASPHAATTLATVDRIEGLAGIDFLPELADQDEARIESAHGLTTWTWTNDDHLRCVGNCAQANPRSR